MIDREPPVTEDELHAYVDGELAGRPPRRRRGMACRSPGDAARVAAWRAQAEAIRARYGVAADEPVPVRFNLDAWRGKGANGRASLPLRPRSSRS